jgi:starch synthase
LYGLSYGTLPLVRKVGGLADTVTDSSLENLADGTASGFVFDGFNVAEFGAAVRRAFALHARKAEWKRVQKYAMQQQLGWDAAAKVYYELYQMVVN